MFGKLETGDQHQPEIDMIVFCSDIEFLYQETSNEHKQYQGGALFAFVSACDAREALTLIENAIQKMDITIQEIKFISPYDESSWHKSVEGQYYTKLARQAEKTSKVVFSDADVYERE